MESFDSVYLKYLILTTLVFTSKKFTFIWGIRLFLNILKRILESTYTGICGNILYIWTDPELSNVTY